MKYSRRQHFDHIKQQADQKKERPITEQDQQLLDILIAKYNELGRSPTMAEVPEAAEIKARFGIWRNALEAAELPLLNDPEQQRLRQHQENKRVSTNGAESGLSTSKKVPNAKPMKAKSNKAK